MKRDNVQKQGNPKSTTLPITEDYHLHTLANGIRIAHKQVPYTQIAHCGIMLDIGSRDELPHQQGLAHFWEHMAFKGTEKRSSYHIINRLENVGGELNAYTTKEKICSMPRSWTIISIKPWTCWPTSPFIPFFLKSRSSASGM